MATSFVRRSLVSVLCLTAVAIGCAGDQPGVPAGSEGGSEGGAGRGAEAAATVAIAGPVDTKYFTTVLPEGWEILADDIDSMGLMTLAERGTGGAHGVYIKFEPGFKGDPLQNVGKVASDHGGSSPVTSKRNGIDWASTRYTYAGITQTLNITAFEGRKVSFTVMGADATTDPAVRAIFDALELKK